MLKIKATFIYFYLVIFICGHFAKAGFLINDKIDFIADAIFKDVAKQPLKIKKNPPNAIYALGLLGNLNYFFKESNQESSSEEILEYVKEVAFKIYDQQKKLLTNYSNYTSADESLFDKDFKELVLANRYGLFENTPETIYPIQICYAIIFILDAQKKLFVSSLSPKNYCDWHQKLELLFEALSRYKIFVTNQELEQAKSLVDEKYGTKFKKNEKEPFAIDLLKVAAHLKNEFQEEDKSSASKDGIWSWLSNLFNNKSKTKPLFDPALYLKNKLQSSDIAPTGEYDPMFFIKPFEPEGVLQKIAVSFQKESSQDQEQTSAPETFENDIELQVSDFAKNLDYLQNYVKKTLQEIYTNQVADSTSQKKLTQFSLFLKKLLGYITFFEHFNFSENAKLSLKEKNIIFCCLKALVNHSVLSIQKALDLNIDFDEIFFKYKIKKSLNFFFPSNGAGLAVALNRKQTANNLSFERKIKTIFNIHRFILQAQNSFEKKDALKILLKKTEIVLHALVYYFFYAESLGIEKRLMELSPKPKIQKTFSKEEFSQIFKFLNLFLTNDSEMAEKQVSDPCVFLKRSILKFSFKTTLA